MEDSIKENHSKYIGIPSEKSKVSRLKVKSIKVKSIGRRVLYGKRYPTFSKIARHLLDIANIININGLPKDEQIKSLEVMFPLILDNNRIYNHLVDLKAAVLLMKFWIGKKGIWKYPIDTKHECTLSNGIVIKYWCCSIDRHEIEYATELLKGHTLQNKYEVIRLACRKKLLQDQLDEIVNNQKLYKRIHDVYFNFL